MPVEVQIRDKLRLRAVAGLVKGVLLLCALKTVGAIDAGKFALDFALTPIEIESKTEAYPFFAIGFGE